MTVSDAERDRRNRAFAAAIHAADLILDAAARLDTTALDAPDVEPAPLFDASDPATIAALKILDVLDELLPADVDPDDARDVDR